MTDPSDYPHPSSPAVTAVMRGNRRRDTKPELRLRSALHRRGLRFRVDHRVPVVGAGIRGDVVFTKAKVAVLVDGCFWHGCAEHGTQPRANATYWQAKLAGNIARDRRNDQQLADAGWQVVRVWEHEEPEAAAARIHDVVESRRQAGGEDRGARNSPQGSRPARSVGEPSVIAQRDTAHRLG